MAASGQNQFLLPTQQPPVYEIRVSKPIPAINFNQGPHIVRICDIAEGNALYRQLALLCGYLRIPDTHTLMNIINGLEGFVRRFIDAENSNWYAISDPRAASKPAHWLQIRLLSHFFPFEGGDSLCRNFDIVRRRVGLDRNPTINDLAGTALPEHVLPFAGQAMAVVQLMSRVPHLFPDSTNVGAGAVGDPVFNAEDINRASCLLRCARKQLGKHLNQQRALPVHYAYPTAANNTTTPGNIQATIPAGHDAVAPLSVPAMLQYIRNNFVARRDHEALQNSYRQLQAQHAASTQRIAYLEAALRHAYEREQALEVAYILADLKNEAALRDAREQEVRVAARILMNLRNGHF